MSTTTDLTTLKINYLTQEQYDDAVDSGEINENEIYLTPIVDSADVKITDVGYDSATKTLQKMNGSYVRNLVTLSDVAISNDYEDLDNTPVLAEVATSGDYNDLDNLPDLDAIDQKASQNKINLGKFDREQIFQDSSISTAVLSNSNSHTSMQGWGYDSKRDRFICACHDSTNLTTILAVINANEWGTVVARSGELQLGHSNDITYCPNHDRFYITNYEQNASGQEGKLAVINPETLTIERTLTLNQGDTPVVIRYVAHDHDAEIFYCGSYDYLFIYDESFVLLKVIPWDSGQWSGDGTMTRQCMEVIDGNLILGAYSSLNGQLSGTHYNTFDMQSGKINSVVTVDDPYSNYEFEGLCTRQGVIYEFGTHTRLSVTKLFASSSARFDPSNRDIFGLGKQILASADFNDYETVGKYYIRNSTAASATINHPRYGTDSAGFASCSLYVLPLGNSFQHQIAIENLDNGSRIYIRRHENTGDVWNNWYKIAVCHRPSDEISFTNKPVVGMLTAANKLTVNLPLARPLANTQIPYACTLVSGTIKVAKDGNYLVGSSSASESLSDTSVVTDVDIVTDNAGVRVNITFASGISTAFPALLYVFLPSLKLKLPNYI